MRYACAAATTMLTAQIGECSLIRRPCAFQFGSFAGTADLEAAPDSDAAARPKEGWIKVRHVPYIFAAHDCIGGIASGMTVKCASGPCLCVAIAADVKPSRQPHAGGRQQSARSAAQLPRSDALLHANAAAEHRLCSLQVPAHLVSAGNESVSSRDWAAAGRHAGLHGDPGALYPANIHANR